MELKFSQDSITIIGYARDEAMRTGSYGIGIDHLMLGILRHSGNRAVRCLEEADVDVSDLKSHLDSELFSEKAVPYSDADMVRPTRGLQSALSISAFEALKTGSHTVRPVDMLLAITRTEGNASVRYLAARGIDHGKLAALSGTAATAPAEMHIRKEDIAGALEEQLANIFGSKYQETNVYS